MDVEDEAAKTHDDDEATDARCKCPEACDLHPDDPDDDDDGRGVTMADLDALERAAEEELRSVRAVAEAAARDAREARAAQLTRETPPATERQAPPRELSIVARIVAAIVTGLVVTLIVRGVQLAVARRRRRDVQGLAA